MHLKGANSMAVFGLSFRSTLVGTGWATSLLLCISGLRKQSSHLVGPLFLVVKLFPCLDKRLLAESHNYCKLNSGWVWFES